VSIITECRTSEQSPFQGHIGAKFFDDFLRFFKTPGGNEIMRGFIGQVYEIFSSDLPLDFEGNLGLISLIECTKIKREHY